MMVRILYQKKKICMCMYAKEYSMYILYYVCVEVRGKLQGSVLCLHLVFKQSLSCFLPLCCILAYKLPARPLVSIQLLSHCKSIMITDVCYYIQLFMWILGSDSTCQTFVQEFLPAELFPKPRKIIYGKPERQLARQNYVDVFTVLFIY